MCVLGNGTEGTRILAEGFVANVAAYYNSDSFPFRPVHSPNRRTGSPYRVRHKDYTLNRQWLKHEQRRPQ